MSDFILGTVVQCHGCFDFLHIGHVEHLQEAKSMGDFLAVSVTSDRFINKGPGRPVFNAEQRAAMLSAIECVDAVAISDSPNAADSIREIRPNIFVRGPDYTDGIDPAEMEALKEVGAELRITKALKLSSTELIRRCAATLDGIPEDVMAAARRYCELRNINARDGLIMARWIIAQTSDTR